MSENLNLVSKPKRMSAGAKIMRGQDALGTKPMPQQLERVARSLANPANFAEAALGMKLYPKQRDALELCAPEGCCVSIACANAGGKTSRILAALVLWLQWLWPSGITKVTSGSYPQVEEQIWPAINRFKDKFPKWRWLETPHFTSFNPDTGISGFFDGFTTNHPGRAEGHHADEMDNEVPNQRRPLNFLVDEAKTSPTWLKGVLLGRVRPTRLVLLSSHGFSEGWFYETQRLIGQRFQTIQITVDDLPHIGEEEKRKIREDFAGAPEFVNAAFGYDFIPLIQDAVINGKALDDCLANPPAVNASGEVHAFCDFAWGGSGAENVLAVRHGNQISVEATFCCDHLTATPSKPDPGICEQFIYHFQRLGLSADQISGDEGSAGRLVMDELDRLGWCLSRVNNGQPSEDDHYVSVGAEAWYRFGAMVTARQLVLDRDNVLRVQLLSRKRLTNVRGKLAIESKDAMKERNVPSPDRADAVVGSAAPGGGYGTRSVSWAQPIRVGRYEPAGI